MTPLAALLGAGTACGIVLIATSTRLNARSAVAALGARATVIPRDRVARAAALGAPVLVATRWPVAGAAAAVLGWYSRDLLGGRAARAAGVARTEAIATWTEMLRDVIGAAHGLEAAVVATAPVAPEPIRDDVLALVADLRSDPLDAALARLAERLAHPIADLVVAALAAASRGSVRDLDDLLGALAASARDEATMQLRVEAARARMRTAVRVITGCTLVTAAFLVVLNPGYVEVYSSSLGQLVLAFIALTWGLALAWLAQMSRFRFPQRFLLTSPSREGLLA